MDPQDNTEEFWKPVPNYESYEVSTLGRVRSWRSHGGKRRAAPKVLAWKHIERV